MKWIRLFEEFQLGDLNFMSPNEIQELFMRECGKETPDLNLIRVIVENGLVDVDARGFMGMTPLHYVIRNGNVSIAKCLISAGADVNAKDNDGRSRLYEATLFCHKEMKNLLKQHGATK